VGPPAGGRASEVVAARTVRAHCQGSRWVGCCASLCLLCCAAARSCRHHDCQVTVAIGHGRVGSRFLRAGRPRQVTPALLVVGGGYTVQQPPRETAPRPLFHGVGLRTRPIQHQQDQRINHVSNKTDTASTRPIQHQQDRCSTNKTDTASTSTASTNRYNVQHQSKQEDKYRNPQLISCYQT
jgi:hypothetical protein